MTVRSFSSRNLYDGECSSRVMRVGEEEGAAVVVAVAVMLNEEAETEARVLRVDGANAAAKKQVLELSIKLLANEAMQ